MNKQDVDDKGGEQRSPVAAAKDIAIEKKVPPITFTTLRRHQENDDSRIDCLRRYSSNPGAFRVAYSSSSAAADNAADVIDVDEVNSNDAVVTNAHVAPSSDEEAAVGGRQQQQQHLWRGSSTGSSILVIPSATPVDEITATTAHAAAAVVVAAELVEVALSTKSRGDDDYDDVFRSRSKKCRWAAMFGIALLAAVILAVVVGVLLVANNKNGGISTSSSNSTVHTPSTTDNNNGSSSDGDDQYH